MLLRDSISPSLGGFVLSCSYFLINTFQWAVRTFADTENQMISVERLLHYCNDLEQESPSIITNNRPSPMWPKRGDITFEKVVIKYHPSQQPVLNNISFTIQHKRKIGIVGRTGAGKSTLVLALFRVFECCEGSIIVDNVDIAKIGVGDLRSKLAVIPQDPILFMGTIRTNLDPANIHTDQELWKTLEKVKFRKLVIALGGLNASVAEGGGNFSVGEKQLLCIGRALLMKSKIVILDEATAYVDIETDNLIQKALRKHFVNCTVLTVAHRLHSVIDCDKIMVLEKGELVEYDTPQNLLKNSKSMFSALVNETE